MRARTHFESLDKKKAEPSPTPIAGAIKQAIIIDELPYQVNKAALISRIAELARDKKIEGISDLRDESEPLRHSALVIELRRGENAEVVLNNLFKETPMQENFSINMVCLDDGAPKLMGVKDILSRFLRHRREVVVRRTVFELRRARAKAHLLEGQAAAVDNVDAIVNLIKSSPSPAAAEKELLARGVEVDDGVGDAGAAAFAGGRRAGRRGAGEGLAKGRLSFVGGAGEGDFEICGWRDSPHWSAKKLQPTTRRWWTKFCRAFACWPRRKKLTA